MGRTEFVKRMGKHVLSTSKNLTAILHQQSRQLSRQPSRQQSHQLTENHGKFLVLYYVMGKSFVPRLWEAVATVAWIIAKIIQMRLATHLEISCECCKEKCPESNQLTQYGAFLIGDPCFDWSQVIACFSLNVHHCLHWH